MTECIVASAPGKVVLSGEYAVLDGAPAICMAVDRRARVRIEATGDDFHEVIAPGHVDEPRRFLVRDGIFGWLDSSDEFELLEHVWRTSGVDRQGGLALELDTSAFLDPVRGCKTGIGSTRVAQTRWRSRIRPISISRAVSAAVSISQLQAPAGSSTIV